MLNINNLSTYYGKSQILKEISLFVDSGEIVALIGSNGAGKTTLLKTIAGLLHPREGTITFCGNTISAMAPEFIVKQGIALCPEGRKVFVDLTVFENLQLGAYTKRTTSKIKEMLQRMLDLFPILHERLKQKAGTLSGGEQQQLAIARALMSSPKLLLLDEPSLGLAPIVSEKIAAIIQTINEEQHISILLVEQNAQLALTLAQRGYVLETGQFILHDEASRLLHNEQIKAAYLGC
ncbi:MAG: ABC transporter ATP-binding protein [Candidatus Margulisiibacteriota bacterium]